MCLVKKPKIIAPSGSDKDKKLPILRNPFLDGIGGSVNSIRIGRNMLRINRDMDRGPGRFSRRGSGSSSGGSYSSGGTTSSGSSGSTTSSGGGGGSSFGSVKSL